MLPKMNCPYRIEPHQIQGLDCIHIFPVIQVNNFISRIFNFFINILITNNYFQWLVKRSMETREQTADFVRSFALSQFNKKHSFSEDSYTTQIVKENLIKNIQLITVKHISKLW